MTLLNRINVPIGIDTTEQLGGEVHVVEVIDNLVPVGLLGIPYEARKVDTHVSLTAEGAHISRS